METVEERLFDYIDQKEGCEVITSKGITIAIEDDDTLRAEYTFLATDDASLSVCFRSQVKGFVVSLEIHEIQDIHKIVPGRLMELYYEGLAEIVCFVSVYYPYCMSFQRIGKVIIAENDRGSLHCVPIKKKLENPDQFVAYANQYYELRECCEN
jgi:hypothetical protein